MWFEMDAKSLNEGEVFYDEWRVGMYHCIQCDAELYGSEDKYRADNRWPQFRKLSQPENVNFSTDNTYALGLTQISCKCGQPIGHLFREKTTLSGDNPSLSTNERHCLMSQSLKFACDPTQPTSQPPTHTPQPLELKIVDITPDKPCKPIDLFPDVELLNSEQSDISPDWKVSQNPPSRIGRIFYMFGGILATGVGLYFVHKLYSASVNDF